MDRDQNQRPACAVCNHHRRRCPPNCFIAKYFPHDESVNFADAHKLFGIGNIVKWAKDVELKLQSDDVERAMKNMKTEANIYASDPSGTGCYGVIRRLATQCYYAEEELKATRQSLDLYRPKGFQDFHNLQPNPFSNDRNRNPYNAFENQFPASWPFVNDENRNLYNAVQNQFPASWGRLLLHNRKQFSDSWEELRNYHNQLPALQEFVNDQNQNAYNASWAWARSIHDQNQFLAFLQFVNDKNQNLYNAVQYQFPASSAQSILDRNQFPASRPLVNDQNQNVYNNNTSSAFQNQPSRFHSSAQWVHDIDNVTIIQQSDSANSLSLGLCLSGHPELIFIMQLS